MEKFKKLCKEKIKEKNNYAIISNQGEFNLTEENIEELKETGTVELCISEFTFEKEDVVYSIANIDNKIVENFIKEKD